MWNVLTGLETAVSAGSAGGVRECQLDPQAHGKLKPLLERHCQFSCVIQGACFFSELVPVELDVRESLEVLPLLLNVATPRAGIANGNSDFEKEINTQIRI